MSLPVEVLARLLHEAGREAVEMGATVAADHLGESAREFLEWDEISENAREGRRIQARVLLKILDISKKDTDWVVATRVLRYSGPEWLVRSALDHSIHGVKILGNGLTIREDRVEVVKVRDGEEEEIASANNQ